MNIKGLQIQQLPQRHPQQRILSQCRYTGQKKHLHKRITPGYRYIRHQKSKSSHRSTSFNHDTSQSKKKTMQSSELESGLPDEAEQECIVFFLLRGRRELNRNSAEIMKRNEIPKRLIGEKGKIDFQFTNN